ncbi:piggyBac transposable element-derived protein 3-like [Stegodyphus dumicola]|uniref:piggyBac transposable element-derived protein 3-like n=1 Tax=Stegodyphus dumicola TaxID=202533 RepID=UPI0015AE4054|nr:piggyBac transposable element-derived protein 3-like [Stegodyphus dumicola]
MVLKLMADCARSTSFTGIPDVHSVAGSPPILISEPTRTMKSFPNFLTSEKRSVSDAIATTGTTETAGTVEILVENEDEEIYVPKPDWKDCVPKISRASELFSQYSNQSITDLVSGKSPAELFEYIAEKIIDKAVIESNRYAGQKNNHKFSLTKPEFKQFLGTLFYSGYHVLPREKMYWENAPDTGTILISRAMPRSRYFEIKRYIQFNDNSTIDSDRYYKVRPIYDLLNDALQQLGVFSEHLNIDERMLRYFGRHGCEMYMKENQ